MLHGLARSSTSFWFLEWRLKNAGYQVVNVDYESTEDTIEVLANRVIPKALKQCEGAARIHFVTHSMGGILVRYYFNNQSVRPENLGHVVMLAPPNRGSEVVDGLAEIPVFEMWNGKAGKQLSTAPDSLPNRLGPVDYSTGVIAGNQSISPVFSLMIDSENDGKVSVNSTKVDGMSDHITLPVTHTFIMNDAAVFKQISYFLRNGQFQR